MKKILYVLTLILLCIGLSGCSLAKEDVYIVFTSDVHGEVNNGIGYAGVKSYVKEFEWQGDADGVGEGVVLLLVGSLFWLLVLACLLSWSADKVACGDKEGDSKSS